MSRPPRKFHPHPFAYHQQVELGIDALGNHGEGIGRVDGWVVFVPFCLPGERVRARVFRNERNCSHADLVAVLEPAPERVEPRCPLFGRAHDGFLQEAENSSNHLIFWLLGICKGIYSRRASQPSPRTHR